MTPEKLTLVLEALKKVYDNVSFYGEVREAIAAIEAALAQPEQETQAYREAAQLAKWLFKTHYAQEEHYASGRIIWGLSDTTAGVISQIDNMVCKLVLPKEPEQKPDCVGTGVCVQTGLVCLGQTPQQQQPASPQVDVLVVNLIRAGVNKHLARELAEHSFKHTTPPHYRQSQ